MNRSKLELIKKSEINQRVERSKQTGFSSPATHYNEPRIDLNEELVNNSSSTFFVRISDDAFTEHGIETSDVLIVDKSLSPSCDQLVLAVINDAFSIIRLNESGRSQLQVWGVVTYVIKSVL